VELDVHRVLRGSFARALGFAHVEESVGSVDCRDLRHQLVVGEAALGVDAGRHAVDLVLADYLLVDEAVDHVRPELQGHRHFVAVRILVPLFPIEEACERVSLAVATDDTVHVERTAAV
jgi:hypothetical protein